MARPVATLVALASLLVSAALVTLGGAPIAAAEDREPAYPLDAIARDAPAEGPLACPKVGIEEYKGTRFKISPAAWVHPAFRERLERFERVVAAVSTEVYGRPPRTLVSLGTYACRRMTAHSELLSEHALGNAIDVGGFDFDALPKDASLPPGLEKAFRNGFEVRVLTHWSATTAHGAVHARFLRTLAQRLIEREDVFRVLLGPGYPGHKNHFHFDVATYRLAQIF